MKDTDMQAAANDKTSNTNNKTKITSRQIVAMTGVVLLVLLYVVTLILAVIDSSASGKFFALSLCGTLAIPIILFLYSWMYGRITGKKVIGDPGQTDESKETFQEAQSADKPKT